MDDVNVGHNERDVPWLRRFVASFHDALTAFLYDPLALVHRPLPDDATLLYDRDLWGDGTVYLRPDRTFG